MENSQKRDFRSPFVRSFAMVLGFGLGLLLLILAFSALSTSGENQLDYDFSVQIMPNAQGERKVLASKAPVILKVNLDGVIGLEDLTRQKISKMLVESRERTLKDDRVKAIILNIDSPGGTVVDADGIYHLLKAYKQQYSVPIYAYVDGLCASGGMYIACAADKIYASESSLIGSVGVLLPTVLNFYNTMQMLGIESKTITAGKDKDELNPLRKWQPAEGENYQMLVDNFYTLFTEVVSSNRKDLDKEKLIAEYGAKIFPAREAASLGYIDGSGYKYRQVLKLLAKEIDAAEGKYQVIELKEKSWLLSFLESKNQRLKGPNVVTHRFDLPVEWDTRLANQFLYLYRP